MTSGKPWVYRVTVPSEQSMGFVAGLMLDDIDFDVIEEGDPA